jgi:effector-binding domain-containing protein
MTRLTLSRTKAFGMLLAVSLLALPGSGLAQTPPAAIPPAAVPPAASPPAAAPPAANPVPTITFPAPAQPSQAQPSQAQPSQAQPSQAQPAPVAPAPQAETGPGTTSSPPPGNPNFAAELTLTARPVVYVKGTSNWDEAYDKLVAAFRQVNEYITRNGLKAAGLPFTVYLSTDDTGFEFQAAIPLEEAPKTKPRMPIQAGESPAGKALRFTHTGSYEDMDSLYEAITNYLDEKALEARESFVEEYETDPVTTPGSDLVVNIYVLLK